MCPIITFGDIRIISFNLVLIIAVFTCIVVYIESDKYSLFAFGKVIYSLAYALFFCCIGGHLLSAMVMTLKSEFNFYYSLMHSGFAFYGGLIGAVVGIGLYCKIHKEKLLEYLDIIFSLLPLGQSIGRFGCFLNGCCYGRAYFGFAAVLYPIDGNMILVFPTWFVESFLCMTLFLYMQFICRKRIRGYHTSVYLFGYSVIRFLVEFMRGDEIRGVWGSISTSQIISIAGFLCGCSIALKILNKQNTSMNDMLKERNKK